MSTLMPNIMSDSHLTQPHTADTAAGRTRTDSNGPFFALFLSFFVLTVRRAGLTVSLINIPLSVSLAVASQSTPTAGIITAVWAGLVAAVLGGSEFNITGPTGALAGILANYALLFGADILPLLSITSSLIIAAVYLLKWDKYMVSDTASRFPPSPQSNPPVPRTDPRYDGLCLLLCLSALSSVLDRAWLHCRRGSDHREQSAEQCIGHRRRGSARQLRAQHTGDAVPHRRE